MNLSSSWELIFSFVAGFILTSLIFTAGVHFTVGQQTCELAESIEEDSEPDNSISQSPSSIISTESACMTLGERWKNSLTSNPVYTPYFWVISVGGGLLGFSAAYYRQN